MHAKFEELYNDAQLKIDQIAERILTLGRTPYHSFSEYLEASQIKEYKNINKGKDSVEIVLSSLKAIIIVERETLKKAAELEDEGTITMLTDFITQQEKEIWMFSSWLKKHD